MVSAKTCIKCKGRNWCGEKCWILEKYNNKQKAYKNLELKGNEFQGSSPPSVFVSWHGYPKVNLAPMSPSYITTDSDLLDNPERWFGLEAEKIVGYREELIRSNVSVGVDEAKNPDYSIQNIQEIVMAKKPVDLEVKLKGRPVTRLSFSDSLAPMGPSASMQDFSVTGNIKIAKKIDYIVSDSDMKTKDAIQELFPKTSVISLHKLLSAGLLGEKKARKFVPTRWSITAIDSQLSNLMIDRIRDFQELGELQLFFSEYHDNRFWILLVPSSWMFEQLEAWAPGSTWNPGMEINILSDHEFYNGRTDYASNVAGGYYAGRIAACEYLMKVKRQAAVIIFREIGDGGKLPLGVWVIRSTVRDAFKRKSLNFFDINTALKYIDSKTKIPLNKWIKSSKILDKLLYQRTLFDFHNP